VHTMCALADVRDKTAKRIQTGIEMHEKKSWNIDARDAKDEGVQESSTIWDPLGCEPMPSVCA
jgi:hypothetical protein